MPHLDWSDALNLGVEEVDRQHRHLVEIANELLDEVRSENGQKAVDHAIAKLREYTLEHFRSEEEFMNSIGYPEREAHEQEHELLTRQVKKYQKALYQKDVVSVEEVKNFLKEWLIGHILGSDMKIAKFLRS